MSARLSVHRLESTAPEQAVEQALAPWLAELPVGRSVLFGLIGWAPTPGLAVSPWILDGLVRACETAALRWQWTFMGPAPSPGRLSRWHPEHLLDHLVDGGDKRSLALDVPGARRPPRIPQAWVGTHLVLVAPCVTLYPDKGGPEKGAEIGPAALALRSVTRACGLAASEQSPQVGARTLGSVFASTTLVLDASWWAPLRSDDDLAPPLLLALDRMFVTGAATPNPQWIEDVAPRIDRFVESRLQRRPHAIVRSELELSGDGVDGSWPKAPVQKHKRGLAAGDVLEALWTAGRRRNGVTGRQLPPSVPGALARQWHYGPDFASRPSGAGSASRPSGAASASRPSGAASRISRPS